MPKRRAIPGRRKLSKSHPEAWSSARADVHRPREDAARTYDRLSGVYDLTEGPFERPYQDLGLRLLAARPGERVLEIGHGTGRCMMKLARAVGVDGRVTGLDISQGMHRVAERRLTRAGLADRADLRVGDAIAAPFADGSFDAIFTSFCLELFAAADIPVVLGECIRVLRPGGRIVVVSLASTSHRGLMKRAYLWGHSLPAPRRLPTHPRSGGRGAGGPAYRPRDPPSAVGTARRRAQSHGPE